MQEYLAANPGAKLISLGIGDTTHPLPAPIADAMAAYCKGLGTMDGCVCAKWHVPVCMRLLCAPTPLGSKFVAKSSAACLSGIERTHCGRHMARRTFGEGDEELLTCMVPQV